MDESPPPADPRRPELGPSEYAAAAEGPPSRLTDDERSLLAHLALRRVAADLARLSWLARGGGVKDQVSSHERAGPLYYPSHRVGA
jgi:hypothetical protein